MALRLAKMCCIKAKSTLSFSEGIPNLKGLYGFLSAILLSQSILNGKLANMQGLIPSNPDKINSNMCNP
jgi:hypothetical protein